MKGNEWKWKANEWNMNGKWKENERKMNGNERKMNGHERKMNGHERKMEGNERKWKQWATLRSINMKQGPTDLVDLVDLVGGVINPMLALLQQHLKSQHLKRLFPNQAKICKNQLHSACWYAPVSWPKLFRCVWMILWTKSEGPLFDFWLNLLDEKQLGPEGWPRRQVNPGTVGTVVSRERIPPVPFRYKDRPDWLIQPEWQAQDSTMRQTSIEHLYTFVGSLHWKRFPDPSELLQIWNDFIRLSKSLLQKTAISKSWTYWACSTRSPFVDGPAANNFQPSQFWDPLGIVEAVPDGWHGLPSVVNEPSMNPQLKQFKQSWKSSCAKVRIQTFCAATLNLSRLNNGHLSIHGRMQRNARGTIAHIWQFGQLISGWQAHHSHLSSENEKQTKLYRKVSLWCANFSCSFAAPRGVYLL